MPRKTSRDALKDYLKADYDRWRVLARNSSFRDDLKEYLNSCGPNLSPEWRKRPVLSSRIRVKFQHLQEQYLSKWGIIRVPDPALWPEDDLVIEPEGLERWYLAARNEDDEFTTGICHPAYMTDIRKGPTANQMYVEFLLDVSIPVDHLTALLENEVRKWLWQQYGEHTRGKPSSLNFHLKVFDLMHSLTNSKRLTFVDVSRKLGKKPSTIRNAYYFACRKIGLTDRNSTPVFIGECSDTKCRNAQSPDDFCQAHKAYINRSY